MTAEALIGDFRRRGISLLSRNGNLLVRPAAGLTPADRGAIRAHVSDLILALDAGGGTVAEAPGPPAGEPWDRREAVRLLESCDALVERLGADGRHPEIQAAAARVLAACDFRDRDAVRFSAAEFAVVVRTIASPRAPGPNPSAPSGV